MTDDEVMVIAEELMRAGEAGDVARLREIYAPDAVVWHNIDGKEQSVDQALEMIGWSAKHLLDLRHDDVRRQRTERGFVQQHVLRATTPGDAELSVPSCIVVEVRDGHVTRLDEYLDARAFNVLVAEDERGG